MSERPPLPPSVRSGPPPLPSEVRKGPPPLPADIRRGPPPLPAFDTKAGGPPPLPKIESEPPLPTPERPEGRFFTNERAQRAELALVHVSDAARGVELSFGMKRGEKRGAGARGEDGFVYDPETGIGGVADGLGENGTGEGALASEFVTKRMRLFYKESQNAQQELNVTARDMQALARRQVEAEGYISTHPEYSSKVQELIKNYTSLPPEVQKELLVLENAVERAHAALTTAKKDKTSGVDGKTTFSGGKTVTLSDGRRFEVFTQVGDGKVQFVKKDGTVENCLPEHSLINFLRSKGIDVDQDPIVLPNGQTMAQDTAKRGMYSALGALEQQNIHPFVGVREIQPGHSVLYMTDGLADVEEAMDKTPAALKGKKPEQHAQALLELVAQFDNKKDDKAVMAKSFGQVPTAEQRSGSAAA